MHRCFISLKRKIILVQKLSNLLELNWLVLSYGLPTLHAGVVLSLPSGPRAVTVSTLACKPEVSG